MSLPLSSAITTVDGGVVKWLRGTPTLDLKAALVNEEEELLMTTFRPVIQELQKIIENDPDLYMGFCQMFERIAEDPKHKVDPLGNPQVGWFIGT